MSSERGAQRLELIAKKMFDDAEKISRGNHSIRALANEGVLNLEEYVNISVDAFFIRSQAGGDASAHYVGQREAAYLSQAQITAREKIGTDNLQQCVALIIKGDHKATGETRVGFAHVDKLTTKESLQLFIEQFEIKSDTYIEVVGARDQSHHKAVSQSNSALVLNTIAECMKDVAPSVRPIINHSMLRNDKVGPNIIYNPSDNSITPGLPLKGHRTMPDRATSRRVQNIHKQAEWRSSDPSERCRDLRVMDLNHVTPQHGLSTKEKRDILRSYPTKIDEHLQELDKRRDVDFRPDVSEYCATRLQPFIRGVAVALRESGYNFTMEEIYRGNPEVKVAALQAKPSRPLKTSAVAQRAAQIAATLQAQQSHGARQVLPPRLSRRLNIGGVTTDHSDI